MSNILYLLSKTKYQVSGLNLENFLFDLSSAGISVNNLKRKKHTITFKSSSVNNMAITSCAHNLGLSIKPLGDFGLIRFIKSLPYCIGAILGLIYSVFCVIYFTSCITNIEYLIDKNHTCTNHNMCIFKDENFLNIKNFIADYVQVGSNFKIKINELQNKVMANFDLVENCSIVKNGCTVTIELTEAIGKQTGLAQKIVASNNCVIASITTFSGKPLVKAGDVVTKGQVLVENIGEVLPRADIVAKVWYTGTAVHNQNQTLLKETGNVYTTTSISAFDKVFLKPNSCNFKYYTLKCQTTYITNMLLPIKKQTYTFVELELVQEYVDFESVKANVLAKSKADALNKTKGTPIECTYSIVKQNGVVRVDCFLLVQEQLGTI